VPEETSARSLSLQSSEPPEPSRGGRAGLALVAVVLVALLAGLGVVGYRVTRRLDAIGRRIASLEARADEATSAAREARERAAVAEESARVAAEGRQRAEAEASSARDEASGARQEADAARQQTASAVRKAALAEAEADRARKEAEAEIGRLEEALSQVAETRRTALGLVMNLGSDHLKFDFDKADIRPEDREMLSRIAGILLTSHDYSISVNGHTDDVGTEEYNQKLSQRRAEAVRDYLVKAGLPAEIFTVKGYGKTHPLVPGSSEEARAKNRRVELGIAYTRIVYGREAVRQGPAAPKPER
jgi:outer membrane protein OmpA-like peptidoglycan-associated protein